jgi:nitrous oxidase accessory protein NosD
MRLLIPFLFAIPLYIHGAVYDVGPNTTYASFNAALISASADALGLPPTETITVQAKAGVYSESVQVPPFSQPLQIMAVFGENVVISSTAASAYGIHVSGCPNVLIQGLKINNHLQAGVLIDSCPGATLRLNQLSDNSTELWIKSSPNVLVSDNILQPSNGSAFLMQDSPNSAIQYNQVSKSDPANSDYSSGITVTNSAGSLLFRNRVFDALTGFSIFASNAVTLSANVSLARAGTTGVVIDNSNGCWLRNNLLVGQDYGLQVQYSPFNAIHNNSIWSHGTAGIFLQGSPSVVLRNNILNGFAALVVDASNQSTLDSNYNDLLGSVYTALGASTYATLGDWQATSHDTLQSLSADPIFVNASGAQDTDFQLQGGSPVQGHGQDLSSLFSVDYFDNQRLAPWDQGFHGLNVLPATPSPTFTASPIVPTATPTPTISPTVSPTPTYSPIATATPTPTISPLNTITPTNSPTAYPIKHDKLVSYPNPYNPGLGIPLNFVFDPADSVSLRIFDISGALVVELASQNILGSSGYATWDGKGEGNRILPAGLYFAVLRSSKGNHFTRFTIIY